MFSSIKYFFFFFSSRRRHTRLQGDWSSDVCSSDLLVNNISSSLNDVFKISLEEQGQLLKEGAKNLSAYATELLLSTSFLVYFFIQVPIYIFLFLMYRNRLKEFLLALKPGSNLKWKDEIQSVARSYI